MLPSLAAGIGVGGFGRKMSHPCRIAAIIMATFIQVALEEMYHRIILPDAMWWWPQAGSGATGFFIFMWFFIFVPMCVWTAAAKRCADHLASDI
jgi:hypothetical protein